MCGPVAAPGRVKIPALRKRGLGEDFNSISSVHTDSLNVYIQEIFIC